MQTTTEAERKKVRKRGREAGMGGGVDEKHPD